MTQERWSEVDDYLAAALLPPDAALEAALAASDAAGLPAIQVSATQGKLLELLARIRGARRILEIGTLAGYSTIWLARALPEDGRLVTLEADPRHAQVATANLARAGFGDRVEVRVGKALDTLPGVEADRLGPFDLFFIDADKANIPEYMRWAMHLASPGAVIVVDNVVRGGAVADADSGDQSVEGSRRLIDMLSVEPRLDATVIQTVGGKGYDGFALALVKE
jgi:predicted O-methyltransferase YrrM